MFVNEISIYCMFNVDYTFPLSTVRNQNFLPQNYAKVTNDSYEYTIYIVRNSLQYAIRIYI